MVKTMGFLQLNGGHLWRVLKEKKESIYKEMLDKAVVSKAHSSIENLLQ